MQDLVWTSAHRRNSTHCGMRERKRDREGGRRGGREGEKGRDGGGGRRGGGEGEKGNRVKHVNTVNKEEMRKKVSRGTKRIRDIYCQHFDCTHRISNI